jgi:cell division protein ZapA
MAKISLKVVVAGRAYPLSVEEMEKEAILSAVDDINRRIKILQDNYAVKDMQDLLAMTALQLSAAPKKQQENAVIDLSNAKDQLKKLLSEISE